jgi:hypothetical protein
MNVPDEELKRKWKADRAADRVIIEAMRPYLTNLRRRYPSGSSDQRAKLVNKMRQAYDDLDACMEEIEMRFGDR